MLSEIMSEVSETAGQKLVVDAAGIVSIFICNLPG